MLNPFPEFLNFSFFAPFFLRVVLGLIFIDLGWLKFKSEKARWLMSFEALNLAPILLSIYAVVEIVGGLMLIAGFWTQVAALVLAIFSGIEFYIEYKEASVLKRNLVF